MKSMKRYGMIGILCILLLLCAGCGSSGSTAKQEQADSDVQTDWNQLEKTGSLELSYADQFEVSYYEGGYTWISVVEGDSFLVVPENQTVPENLPEDVRVLKQPIRNVYLVSTSAMDLFCAIDGLDAIRLTGTKEKDWYVEPAREAMENGEILYAGKYNAPDYEKILEQDCDLAVENTMILHNPEVKEQLEQLNIPVLVERSSYESHPLGRLEWIKLYGALLGKDALAKRFFDEQIAKLESYEPTGKTVAFFYITSNGAVSVRKPGDYVSKMIGLAGGTYAFQNLGVEEENALSTMKIQMETFYATAKDADYLIYNSTIDGEIQSVDELMQKSELLQDFKAVQNGNVWCTQKSMFQESTGIVDMIVDMHRILTEQQPQDLKYIYHLE